MSLDKLLSRVCLCQHSSSCIICQFHHHHHHHRLAPWKALRASGTPSFLVQLLENMHQCTKSRVRADGEPFDTTSGVRQGCVLAPALFCFGFSTDAQSPWVSQLVLLALQMKPMPMMVFCSLTARQNGQKY